MMWIHLFSVAGERSSFAASNCSLLSLCAGRLLSLSPLSLFPFSPTHPSLCRAIRGKKEHLIHLLSKWSDHSTIVSAFCKSLRRLVTQMPTVPTNCHTGEEVHRHTDTQITWREAGGVGGDWFENKRGGEVSKRASNCLSQHSTHTHTHTNTDTHATNIVSEVVNSLFSIETETLSARKQSSHTHDLTTWSEGIFNWLTLLHSLSSSSLSLSRSLSFISCTLFVK